MVTMHPPAQDKNQIGRPGRSDVAMDVDSRLVEALARSSWPAVEGVHDCCRSFWSSNSAGALRQSSPMGMRMGCYGIWRELVKGARVFPHRWLG
ncbi:hypothetical protein DUNSADRAFT_11797 [Dunaliella salina]|uniref:Encoded protein n=1 Tax=Dunaliella salina TaxID=3046 RepID=A0ABQ7GCI8_DUNSA|nr:hypothetical protein DUNSADRAFT_11797 [Dunaliella salina]|eukprot:KAF5832321.1 hypothetical protein DUNSADRAFT_11797 [Dunaliella salina]